VPLALKSGIESIRLAQESEVLEMKSTYSLDLQFLSPHRVKKGALGHAIARVLVKTCRAGDGSVFITPDCASLAELEDHIDRLKGELEKIREAARREFDAHDRHEKEWPADTDSGGG
jgi:hypothetical protein